MKSLVMTELVILGLVVVALLIALFAVVYFLVRFVLQRFALIGLNAQQRRAVRALWKHDDHWFAAFMGWTTEDEPWLIEADVLRAHETCQTLGISDARIRLCLL